MDRRAFFRSALDKSSKTVVKTIDASVNKQASRWIRPPYALDELGFLLACTRCGDCIAACPHDVVFALSARTGARTVGTPALDLLNKGCHLCSDWPCVSACETGALLIAAVETEETEASQPAPPMLAKAAIDEHSCLPYLGPECGACIDSCPIPEALLLSSNKPLINTSICNGCGMCREACISEPKAIQITSLYHH